MVNQEKEFTSRVVMEIRLNLHCEAVATHVSTLEEKEKQELKNLLKWGKFSLYVMVDREIFTYLKNKKQLILAINETFKIFNF